MNVTISSSSNSPAGKGCATMFLGVFAIAGMVLLGFFVRAGWDTVRAYTWTKTDCVIESSAMQEKGDSAEFTVRYTYRFGGRSHTGTRYTIGMSHSMNLEIAQRAVQRYPAGQQAFCYVNGSAPAESTLHRSGLWELLFGFIPVILIAVGVGGIIAVWRSKPEFATAISERHRGGKGAVIAMRLLGLAFVLIGGGVMYAMLVHPMRQEMAAAKWPKVPCEILSSKVGRHSGSEGDSTYSVDVRYRYNFGGRELIGTKYNFDMGTSNIRGWRETVVASLPAGTRTVCYVNPDDPLDAVLKVNGSPDRWFGLIPTVFVIVGLALLLKAPTMIRINSVPSRASPGTDGGLPSIPRGGTAGETVLKQASPPGCTFAALTVFALIWNGFVWFMVLSMKGGGWGPRLFMSIFVLVGLALIVAALRMFLALFNPRPVLTVSAPAVPLGGTLDVRWRFTGNVRRIVKLKIALMAREEATYRRGTTTTTDKSVFLNTVLLDTADRAQIAGGGMKVNIPRDLIHTFSAPNNKIVWMLQVHGDIPRWPDVNAEFPITVLPRDTATLFQEHPPAT